MAQAYANEYEAASPVYGDKYNKDALIQAAYEQRQIDLMEKSGLSRQQALDLLAQRSATRQWKQSAMYMNALGELGDIYSKNRAENKASLLYQDMFPNVGYTGDVTYTTGSGQPYASVSGKPLTETQIEYNTKLYNMQKAKAEAEKATAEKPTKTRYGGKIKLPKKPVKRMKAVR